MASLKKVGTQFLADVPTLLTQRLNKERLSSSFSLLLIKKTYGLMLLGKC